VKHQGVGGKAAVNGDPKMPWRAADIFVAKPAGRALSATDPRINRDLTAGFYGRVRSGSFDPAGNFVAKRERKRTPRANIQLFSSTKHKITILHVQVGMADAATFDPDQHLGALWRWQVCHRFAERRAVGCQRLSVYFHAS